MATTKKVLKVIYMVLFIVVYTMLFLQTTMLQPMADASISNVVSLALTITIAVSAFAAILGYVEKKKVLPLFLKLILIYIATQFFMLRGGDELVCSLTALILFAVSADLWEEDNLLKTAFFIGLAIVVIFFILSLLGIVENNRGNSFGFIYRTDYACHLLCLALIWCVIKDGRLTWLGELELVALDVFIFWIGGKTAFICLTLLILVTVSRNHMKKWAVSEKLCRVMKYSVLFFAGLSFLLALSFRVLIPLWDKLPGLSTAKDRMDYSLLGLENIQISLLGTPLVETGSGLSEKSADLYFFLDNAYIRTFLLYGVLMLAAFIAVMTITQFRLHKEKRCYAMFAVSLLSLSGMMEFEFINIAYNMLAVLAFCKLSEKPGIEACDKLSLEKIFTDKHWDVAGGAAVFIAFFALWSSTAYQITNWRGWTPDYDATIVVTESKQDLLTRTQQYMTHRSDAACVVRTDTDKKWLVENGIDGERVWVQQTDDIDSMLISASVLVKEKKLPSRLTVCAYNVQQERISRYAKNLHIPVNSLAVKPTSDYMTLFAAEQWRLLWGE